MIGKLLFGAAVIALGTVAAVLVLRKFDGGPRALPDALNGDVRG